MPVTSGGQEVNATMRHRRRPSQANAGSGTLWRHGTTGERVLAITALALLAVTTVLTALDHAAWPLTLNLLLACVLVLFSLRVRVRRRRRRQRALAAEVSRGLRELERWLAARPRA